MEHAKNEAPIIVIQGEVAAEGQLGQLGDLGRRTSSSSSTTELSSQIKGVHGLQQSIFFECLVVNEPHPPVEDLEDHGVFDSTAHLVALYKSTHRRESLSTGDPQRPVSSSSPPIKELAAAEGFSFNVLSNTTSRSSTVASSPTSPRFSPFAILRGVAAASTSASASLPPSSSTHRPDPARSSSTPSIPVLDPKKLTAPELVRSSSAQGSKTSTLISSLDEREVEGFAVIRSGLLVRNGSASSKHRQGKQKEEKTDPHQNSYNSMPVIASSAPTKKPKPTSRKLTKKTRTKQASLPKIKTPPVYNASDDDECIAGPSYSHNHQDTRGSSTNPESPSASPLDDSNPKLTVQPSRIAEFSNAVLKDKEKTSSSSPSQHADKPRKRGSASSDDNYHADVEGSTTHMTTPTGAFKFVSSRPVLQNGSKRNDHHRDSSTNAILAPAIGGSEGGVGGGGKTTSIWGHALKLGRTGRKGSSGTSYVRDEGSLSPPVSPLGRSFQVIRRPPQPGKKKPIAPVNEGENGVVEENRKHQEKAEEAKDAASTGSTVMPPPVPNLVKIEEQSELNESNRVDDYSSSCGVNGLGEIERISDHDAKPSVSRLHAVSDQDFTPRRQRRERDHREGLGKAVDDDDDDDNHHHESQRTPRSGPAVPYTTFSGVPEQDSASELEAHSDLLTATSPEVYQHADLTPSFHGGSIEPRPLDPKSSDSDRPIQTHSHTHGHGSTVGHGRRRGPSDSDISFNSWRSSVVDSSASGYDTTATTEAEDQYFIPGEESVQIPAAAVLAVKEMDHRVIGGVGATTGAVNSMPEISE